LEIVKSIVKGMGAGL